MIPKKLRKGNEIRILSPAKSLSMIDQDQQKLAVRRLNDAGFQVTFGTYAAEEYNHISTPVDHRVNDIHDAFADPNVKAILTTIGGYDSNQLLSDLDYQVIRQNPKIFCGYSDITALSNSIYRKTGLVTYSGPHFSSFGMEQGIDYTYEFFLKVCREKDPFNIPPAESWSDDHWYLDQENRQFHKNNGYNVINEGIAEGTSIGGNLCTLNLLQGTEFMPSLEDTILFLEDDLLSDAPTFDRNLQSLIHQPGFYGVKGIIIGRFQKDSKVKDRDLQQIIQSKKELTTIPVISNASFGHTTPIFTFPIGGQVKMKAYNHDTTIELLKY
ncbi:S66 family peptidase [Halobacillus karajensis]|uniref:Microcin C7 self-immunity protein MccF n=1 Tax=Halobacillus karajensis TaxID=195088 RepID=A0A059NZI5_9BACI|nr:S66 peptidase family protein [Halobacillus karajensis]CDQ21159.1 Microcin C7 self-immunity protein MccF [Halobacillus karajensis]CDQ24777.1 Microcin C7 self-immunity protein MccF [Halobacillus karajensis]CDQ28863.1 Microcin C7 self-immunity protein MccF [Halobacillus karajensis]